ncbi:MFS transporter [Catenulispora subtropica]|uniref:MFS transporter n=1 Tax=Catenulispora subtropica TaxID=450798 RepID=A0ABP5ES51_9ACTN
MALPLVAIQYTRSPALIAGLTFAFTLPWLLLALTAGAVADRVDRRVLMLGANAVRAGLVAVLLVALLAGGGSIWLLYAAALLAGTAETFYDTASQAILPQIVRRDQLERANSLLYAAEMTAFEFIGPPLAGFLVAAGVGIAIGAPVGLWAGALALLLLVRGTFKTRAATTRTTLRGDVAEGLRYLARNRPLRTITVMTGVFNLASSAAQAVLVLYAVGQASAMRLTQQQYGWMLSAVAAGCLAGSFVAERAEKALGRARAIALGYLFGGLSVGAPAVTTNAYLIGAAYFVGGVALVIGNVTTLSLRQRITPGRLLGRINSCHRLVAYGTKPLGALLGGLLAQTLGLRAVFAVMGPLAVLTLLGMRQLTDKAMDAAVAETGHQDSQ